MHSPLSEGPASPARKSGCGFRGCLLGCLIPIVAIVIGLLIARPTLEQKWASFRADNPWVAAVPGAAAVLKDVAGGMGGEDDAAVADTSGRRPASAKPVKGVNDKSAMPRDLPLWPRTRAEAFSVAEGSASAYQRVSQSPDSVLRYYRRAMPTQGWKLDQERTGAGGVLLLYRKGSRVSRVEVVADSAGTEIWLRSRTPTAAPDQ